MTIIQDRLVQITRLDHGGHANFEAGVCAMEAVAYVAGKSPIEQAFEAMDARAAEAVVSLIDIRARRYRDDPRLLDKHFPALDLRYADPKTFLARIDALIEQRDRGQLPRWYGFGGESVHLSLAAARLYGDRMLAGEKK